MAHPLEDVIRRADKFVLIGDSSQERFPAQSFHSYTKTGTRFYCLDLGGLTKSRGGSPDQTVYPSLAELPSDHGDLAVIWVRPGSAAAAVDVANEAGCKRVWFSFGTGHKDAVARAREHGMEVVEIGRCPVHYMAEMTGACRLHTTALKVAFAYSKPPQTDPEAKRRELW